MQTSAIPEIKGLPLLGSVLQIKKDPLNFFKQIANTHEGIAKIKALGLDLHLIIDPQISQTILVNKKNQFRYWDNDIKILGQFLGKGLITNNDYEHHKQQRKLIQPAFHFRSLAKYTQTMIDYSNDYISHWQEGTTYDISSEMAALTMSIVAKTMLGIDKKESIKEAKVVRDSIHTIQKIASDDFNAIYRLPQWVPTRKQRSAKKAIGALHSVIDAIIKKRRQEHNTDDDANDFISILLNARYDDDSTISDQQLMDEVVTILVTGHETTANGLTWAMYLLARHPEIQQTLQQELDKVLQGQPLTLEHVQQLEYTEMVFKEALRLYPPLWSLILRQTNEDVQLGEYAIKKDCALIISPYAQHHNEAYFPNPNAFDPQRFNKENSKHIPRYAYIPFSSGARTCIGAAFATIEAKVILASILSRYTLQLAPDTQLAPLAQLTLTNHQGMPLTLTRRS